MLSCGCISETIDYYVEGICLLSLLLVAGNVVSVDFSHFFHADIVRLSDCVASGSVALATSPVSSGASSPIRSCGGEVVSICSRFWKTNANDGLRWGLSPKSCPAVGQPQISVMTDRLFRIYGAFGRGVRICFRYCP